MLLPGPTVGTDHEIEILSGALADGRPINARPFAVPDSFSTELDAAVDADRFYAAIERVGERPCSLATMLAAGWRYKLRRTYPLCDALMRSELPWRDAIGELAAHVQQRCELLQQSVEAAHVQEALSRGRNE